ncbi:MAG: F0F1 ATP synthase subunit epsilon [Actinomycetaceae bacterium]|nr:F0F1 ATP synthase subunit epsilon [Actinomycetaceae bacterium]
MALDVSIVSRERKLWSGKATYVSAPSIDGSVGILPGRQPLLAALTSGEVIVRRDKDIAFSVEAEEGFLSVDSDRVIVALDHTGALEASEHFADDVSEALKTGTEPHAK